jgi:hypothetical protein
MIHFQFSRICQSFSPPRKIIQHQKHCFEADELFHTKNSCTNHDCRIGEYCFVRQLKLIWQNQKINVKKNHFQKKKNQLSLKIFYTPPLDIDQISSIWDQILPNPKTRDNVIEEVWEIARTATFIPFSILTSMFHQCFAEQIS